MPPSTRKMAQTPRPRKPSAKARANASKISKPEPKTHVPKKFINPDALEAEPTPEPMESSPPPIEVPIDVSDIKYTLAISCMLGVTSIFTDTKKFKLGQFQLQDFTGTVIKKLVKATNSAKYTVEWDSATAVISHDYCLKTRWISIDVEEDSRWKVIEEWIEEWMVKKRDNITVKLVINYGKVERDDIESSNEDKLPRRRAKV
jgi:hypothetical protein